MTKICVVSDTHNNHPKIEPCDILIHCGDFGTKGNYSEAEAFLFWLIKQPAKYKVVVAGNHDAKYKTHPDIQKMILDFGIIDLDNSGINILGLNLWGGRYVPFIRDNEYIGSTKEERIDAWKNMPENLDILITHAPPKGIMDINKKEEHCGCDALASLVKQNKPKRHFFGHIHECGGQTYQVNDTIFYNTAVMNELYLTVRDPIYLEI